jgi:hypothetical protein
MICPQCRKIDDVYHVGPKGLVMCLECIAKADSPRPLKPICKMCLEKRVLNHRSLYCPSCLKVRAKNRAAINTRNYRESLKKK